MVQVGFAISQYTKSNLTYQASLAININSLIDKKKTYIPTTPIANKQVELFDTVSIHTPAPEKPIIQDSISTIKDSVPSVIIDTIPQEVPIPSIEEYTEEVEEEVEVVEEVQLEENEQPIDAYQEAWTVIKGTYGNGEERKQRLGKNYTTIQNIVNELYKKELVK
ncbi:MAG: hypothetical protein KBS70_09285 [Bacteroidales bacterium]|nr:hypothetical protein [Candidatus Colicola equi]